MRTPQKTQEITQLSLPVSEDKIEIKKTGNIG